MGKHKTTKTGHIWEQISEDSWKDLTTGLVWSEDLFGTYTFDEAQKIGNMNLSHNLKWRLPTFDDYLIAEDHGIRDILNMKFKIYWASSKYIALAFSGHHHRPYEYIRSVRENVRCVGAPK